MLYLVISLHTTHMGHLGHLVLLEMIWEVESACVPMCVHVYIHACVLFFIYASSGIDVGLVVQSALRLRQGS